MGNSYARPRAEEGAPFLSGEGAPQTVSLSGAHISVSSPSTHSSLLIGRHRELWCLKLSQF